MNYVNDLNKILRSSNYYYNQNKLNGLLYNKSIAIIGSAKYLEEFNQSEKLKQYDYIIRLNFIYKIKGENGTDLPDKIKTNTTSRTDILYSNLNKLDEKGKLNLERLLKWENNNIKFFIGVTPNNPHRLINLKNQMDYYERQDKDNLKKLRFSLIDNELDINLYREIGSWALTGVAAITHLLQMPIKELYITGFDFYENNIVSYNGYSDNKFNETGDHKIENQKKFLMRILEIYKNKVSMDEYLKIILNHPLPNDLSFFNGLYLIPYTGEYYINSFFINRYITKFMKKNNFNICDHTTITTKSWKYVCNYFESRTSALYCAIICYDKDMKLSFIPNSYKNKNQAADSKNKKDLIIKQNNYFIIHPKVIIKFNDNYKITIFNFT